MLLIVENLYNVEKNRLQKSPDKLKSYHSDIFSYISIFIYICKIGSRMTLNQMALNSHLDYITCQLCDLKQVTLVF